MPGFMTRHAVGQSQARIEALQRQEQTEDRDEAEQLASRIGQDEVRDVMQAQDERGSADGESASTDGESGGPSSDAAAPESRAAPPGAQVSDFAGIEVPQVGEGAGDAAVSTVDGDGGAVEGDSTQEDAEDGTSGPDADAGASSQAGEAGTGAGGGSEPVAEDVDRAGEPQEPQTGAGDLGTGDLVLIDFELAEHQRWGAAEARVGGAGSELRAEFVAEQIGSGFIGGVATGAGMSLGIGLVSRAVPVLGPIVGGGLALHGLLTRDWATTGAAIGRFGEGQDTYEALANTLASVSAVIDIVTQVLDVIAGIVGVVEAVAIGVAAGAGVLAFFTFGATAGIAVAAGELAVTCEEIRDGINIVSMALTVINNGLLNPCILLFRALHSFTAQADPREVEEGGQELAAAGGGVGGALGGWLGGHAAQMGARARPAPDDGAPTTQRPSHETPPAAAGDGPEVHFVGPRPQVDEHMIATPGRPVLVEIESSRGLRVTDDQQATPGAAATAVPKPTDVAEPSSRTVSRSEADGPASLDAGGDDSFRLLDEGGERGGITALGPMVRVPLHQTEDGGVLPARVLEVGAGMHETNLGLPPEPELVQRTQTDFNPQRPGVEMLDATAEMPRHLRGQFDTVIVNNPRRFRPDIERLSDALGPGGRIVLQGRSEVPVGQRGINPDFNRLVREVEGGKLPDGLRLVPPDPARPEVPILKIPGVAAGPATDANRPGDIMGGPFYSTTGEPVSWPNTRVVIEPDGAAARGSQTSSSEVMPHTPPESATPSSSADLSSAISPDRPMQIADAPTRSIEPLTREQFEANAQMAVDMGMPRDQIHQAQGDTSYHLGYDVLLIGADVNPLPPSQRPTDLANPANAALEPRAVIGHEVIGHREAALGGQTRDEVWHEELQASARAALHTPELSHEQSWLLLQDAAARRRFQTREGEIYIDTERYGPAAAGNRSELAPRGPGDESSVIIDPSLLEPQPTATLARTSSAMPAHPESDTIAAPVSAASISLATRVGQMSAHPETFADASHPSEGVEHVNPHYSAPPATPQQIVAIQNEILNLLAVRARAEAEAQHESDRVYACDANRAPIAATIADTRGGLSAVNAHEQAIARRDAANQAQQQRQQAAAALTAGYPDRAAGLTVLATPLAAWEGFTSLASHLPGSAGDRMAEMNAEASQMQDSLRQMATHMGTADEQQPGLDAGLTGDAERLAATGEQAADTHADLQTAAEGAVGLRNSNEATLAAAQSRHDDATQRGKALATAAAEREATASSLSEQLRAWAVQHRNERAAATTAVVQRLEHGGCSITRRSPE